MNYMIMLPGGTLGISVDSYVYDIAEAMSKFPGITEELINAGEFHETGVLVDNRYYTEEPTFEFRVNLHTDYPEPYLVDDITLCGGKLGCKLDRRSFNWCYFKTFNYGCAVAFKDWSDVNRPGWTFVIEEEVKAESVQEEEVKAEPESVQEEEVKVEPEPEKEEEVKVEPEPDKAEPEPEPEQQSLSHERYPSPEDAHLDEQEIMQSTLDFSDIPHPKPEDEEVAIEEKVSQPVIGIPEECRGETWAQTWKHCRPEQVEDDAYCVEHNWEKRGDYYIIDCVMTGNRLIHSDKLKVNMAVDAKLCR